MMNRYCVLMTACIDPSQGRIKVHRSDPAIRLNDYLEGLRFWLELDDARVTDIAFIENSGYSLEPLMQLARSFTSTGKSVEFLSLSDNSYPVGTHYGYAELRMIDHAFDASIALKRSTHFIKATGRLTFPGVHSLLDRLPDDFSFAVDSRNSSLFYQEAEFFVSTQLMLFSTSFYRLNLLDIKRELGNAGSHIENLFYRKLMPFKGRPGAILRWPLNVPPRGMAAHWDKDYASLRRWGLNAVRAVCRRVVPNWWI